MAVNIEKKVTQQADYAYNKNGVNLAFSLRTDDGGERMRIFRELLLEAAEDIKVDIAEIEKRGS